MIGRWRRARAPERPSARQARVRQRAQGRIVLLGAAFVLAFGAVGAKMGVMASEAPSARRVAASAADPGARADITDRRGRVLATNMDTVSLYAEVRDIVDAEATAAGLAAIFPELDAGRLAARLRPPRKFTWIRRTLSPEQRQAVHALGEPGLRFGPRQMRVYPAGRLAAHVLGGAGYGVEDVAWAELQGRAGVELAMDAWLSDPARSDGALRLSLDMAVQHAVEEVLAGAMVLMDAKGATAVLMDAATGEIAALASLPDFDPNARPRVLATGDRGDDPLFNRAVQGVYELGSVFKIFTAAQAIDLGLASRATRIDTSGPLRQNGFTIRDFRDYGATLTLEDVIAKSSNRGTARLAVRIGGARQEAFLGALGLFEPVGVELAEAPGARPIVPGRWPDLTVMTVSYGHGIAVSPLHLAAAYAPMVNGGLRVRPTLIAGAGDPGERVLSPGAADAARAMLDRVVNEEIGTAKMARVEGYPVGGKTGTADKPDAAGRYSDDKVIATFAGAFPIGDPRWVLVVTLDEPAERSGETERRTAGWTAVPTAAEIVHRVAPLLGLRPAE